MSQETKCDGCGFREPLGDELSIVPVRIDIGESKNPIHREQHDTHLCGACRGTLLHNYFGMPAQGQLDVPAFLEPTGKERRQ